MNFVRPVSVLALTAAVFTTQARAADAPADIPAQISALEAMVSKTSSATPNDPTAIILNYLHSADNMAQRGDYHNALMLVSRAAEQDPAPDAHAALIKLALALTKASDAAQAQLTGKVQKVFDDATHAVKTSTDPKDFDPILVEISDALENGRAGAYGADIQTIYQRLNGARQFVQAWQSYLVDKQGNPQNAANDLRNLAMQDSSFMPIPRSELLELALKDAGMGGAPGAADTGIEIHSFDDLAPALAKLELMQRTGNFTMEMNYLSGSMQSLRVAYDAYQEKNYPGALQALVNNPFGTVWSGGLMNAASDTAAGKAAPVRAELADLRNQLLIKISQALLALPALPDPQKDEAASDYLLRVADSKEKAADWPALQQVLQVYQQVAGMSPAPWLQEDLAGLHAYLVGEKLEAADQNLDAIRSYRQALATLGRFFPADAPAAKLKDLTKKYPDLYQQALQQPIASRGP